MTKINGKNPPLNCAEIPHYSSNFLCRTYRYRQRANRSPREDFLTECLAELLNSLSVIEKGHYSRELLGILSGVNDMSGIRWSTQVNIAGVGRPDLVGIRPSGEMEGIFIIVENKVGAGYTGSEANDQMSRYKLYLEKRNELHRELVLITHWTPPSARADVVVRWREIAGRLGQWNVEGVLVQYPVAEALSRWLVHFLKEENMSEIKLDLSDIASVASHRRLMDACKAFEEVINPVADSLNDRFRNVNLCTPKSWGEFGTNNYGAPFFGRIWIPENESKAADAAVILWMGIWAGANIYGISPSVPDVPELSVGIGLWEKEEQEGERPFVQMKRLLADTPLSSELVWEGGTRVENENGFGAVFLRKTLPLSECYQPGLDWGDMVKGFFEERQKELMDIDETSLQAITRWNDEDGEEGGSE